jgi:hypothetical protein
MGGPKVADGGFNLRNERVDEPKEHDHATLSRASCRLHLVSQKANRRRGKRNVVRGKLASASGVRRDRHLIRAYASGRLGSGCEDKPSCRTPKVPAQRGAILKKGDLLPEGSPRLHRARKRRLGSPSLSASERPRLPRAC